jgi:thiol-disulfide isomerase/thioredoxin
MAAGWVYVLVNSSMPGLVKVGKTTRLTNDRAAELSGVTGVPTPFLIAFEQFFSDCDIAEEFVHEELMRRGLRVSDNREFFRAATNEVVRIVLQAPGVADAPSITNASELIARADDDSFSEQEPQPKPWAEVFERAESHYYGLGDTIQDYQEALELYSDATRLGSLKAYQRLGDMWRDGEGTRTDAERALEYYKEGAKRGYPPCFASMARLYESSEHPENSEKCWARFFENWEKRDSSDVPSLWEYASECADYIRSVDDWRMSRNFRNHVKLLGNVVRQKIIMTQCKRQTFKAIRERYSIALGWSLTNLSQGINLLEIDLPVSHRPGPAQNSLRQFTGDSGGLLGGFRSIFGRSKTPTPEAVAALSGNRKVNDNAAPSASPPDVPHSEFVSCVGRASINKPVIVELWAPWCAESATFGPRLFRLASNFDIAWTVLRVNIADSEAILEWLWQLGRSDVRAIPALVVFRNAKPVMDTKEVIEEDHILRFFQAVSDLEAGKLENVHKIEF